MKIFFLSGSYWNREGAASTCRCLQQQSGSLLVENCEPTPRSATVRKLPQWGRTFHEHGAGWIREVWSHRGGFELWGSWCHRFRGVFAAGGSGDGWVLDDRWWVSTFKSILILSLILYICSLSYIKNQKFRTHISDILISDKFWMLYLQNGLYWSDSLLW